MALLDPDDELSTLLTLEQAVERAVVSHRTLSRWIKAGRLRLLPGRYVVERELLEVERERRRSRHAGWPGARVSGDLTSDGLLCPQARDLCPPKAPFPPCGAFPIPSAVEQLGSSLGS